MRRRVTNTMMTKNILPILGIAVAGLCGGGVLEPVTLTATPLANDPYDYKDLVVRDVACLRAVTNRGGCVVLDFGRDAIGWLEIGGAAGPYEIVIGEMTNATGRVVNPYPGSTIRVQTLKGLKPEGWFRPAMEPDEWNLTGYAPEVNPAIRLPDRLGLVFPFRYAEIVRLPGEPSPRRFVQKAVNYPIDLSRSAFACSDEALVCVYEFCKYSILATSFAGIYVDGDRERTPYEADAYINQMAHYAIDADMSLARRSFEWLMDHPTWPTEWKQHMVKMAWADWMWTGDTRSLAKFYDRLRDDKLMRKFARASDGLLETGGERKKGAKPGAADIVDWPETERDGFEFRPVNAVVNAFFVRNLEEMRDIAAALGKDGEARSFAADAIRLRAAYQKTFFDSNCGLYVDGEGTSHTSIHANAAALAFGLVPSDHVDRVADWLVSRGMACSTYFSQYLLEALFAAGRDEAAIALMSARGDRSWLGMMEFGATITMESWNMEVKPNQDLNHAWSATPLSMISRFVLGVTPLEPGFAKVLVKPQIGRLSAVSGTVPTVKGPIKVTMRNDVLHVETPVPARVIWKGGTYEMPIGTRDFPAMATFPTFTQKISTEWPSEAEAKAASAEIVELDVGEKYLWACRWDDRNPNHRHLCKALTEVGMKYTAMVNGGSDKGFIPILREIVAAGGAIGSHTMNHDHMSRLLPMQCFREIMQNRIELELASQSPVVTFAAPYGLSSFGHNMRVCGEACVNAGFLGGGEGNGESAAKLGVPEDRWIGTWTYSVNDENPDRIIFAKRLKDGIARIDGGKMRNGPVLTLGIHPWQSEQGRADLAAMVKEAIESTPGLVPVNQNTYVTRRLQFLHSSVEKISTTGRRAEFVLRRPRVCELGANTPILLKLSDGRIFKVDAPADEGVPGTYAEVRNALTFSEDRASFAYTYENTTGAQLKSVEFILRLPPGYEPGVVRKSLRDVAPGFRATLAFSSRPPEDPVARQGTFYAAVEVNFPGTRLWTQLTVPETWKLR